MPSANQPVQKTWGFQPPTQRQKELAQHIKEVDSQPKSQITLDDYRKADRLFWMYQDQDPWYAAAYTGTRRILTRAIPTAAMGWKEGEAVLYINPDFVFALPFVGQRIILNHEMEHLVRSHCQVVADWPEKQMMLNFVMDAIINTALLVNGGFREQDFPKGLITYDVFKQVCAQPVSDPKLRGKKWPDPPPSAADFVHNYNAEQLLEYLPKGNDSDDIGGITTIRQMMKDLHGDLGELFDDSSVPEDMKESIMEQMIAEAEKSIGQAPAHLQRHIDAVKDKTNRDWRMLVRGAGNSSRIRMDRSWFHVHKRKAWIAPGKFIFTEPKGMVMIDTSGSIGQEEMLAFIKELNNLSDQIEIDMGFIDSIWDPDNIPGQYVKNIEAGKAWKHAPVGGGGTAFGKFYEFMQKKRGKYDFCIILTDGYVSDVPMVPGPLAKMNFALMTPNHSPQWVEAAKAAGFKVAVIDDSVRKAREAKRQAGATP